MTKKIILGMLIALLLTSGFPKSSLLAKAGDVYSQDFSDYASVSADFGSYFLYTMGGSSEQSIIGSDASSHECWYVADGAIHRHAVDADIDINLGTNSIAILTLETKKYVNFDLTVEYQMGESTYFWAVVAFRQSEPGKYFLEDGAGVFVQKEGYVTVWGTDGVGGPYESGKIVGYTAVSNAWHTLRIVVDGLNLRVYLDDLQNEAYTRTLSEMIFRAGYISLVSVNNDCSFRNLSITELATTTLDETTKSIPVPDAGTADSLDSIGTAVEDIDELHGLIQDADIIPTPEEPEETGCAAGNILVFSTLVSLLGFLLYRRH